MAQSLILLVSIGGNEVSAQFAHAEGHSAEIPILKESIFSDGLAPGVQHIVTALKKVCERIEKEGFGHIKTVHFFLSAPWALSQTRTIRINNAKGFAISEKAISHLVKEERDLFEAKAKKDNLIQGEERLIESKIMDIQANGYTIAGAIPKDEIQSLTIALFLSIGNGTLMTKMEDTVHRYFHTHRVMFHSIPISLYSATVEKIEHPRDYTIVHLSDEITDVILVKKGIISESISVLSGRNAFVKDIAKALGCSFQLAQSFLHLHSEGKLDQQTTEKIEASIKKTSDKWRIHFCDVLGKISNETFIPHTVTLIADPSIEKILTTIIQSGECAAQIVNTDGFLVTGIDNALLAQPRFINKLEVLS